MTVSAANTADTEQSTMTAAPVSRSRRSLSRTAMMKVATASRRSQSRNDPCWPAQKPESR
jgi:hypothetical protein